MNHRGQEREGQMAGTTTTLGGPVAAALERPKDQRHSHKTRTGSRGLDTTDPRTGQRVAREVTRVWVHDDLVLDLVVNGDVITTTEDHPFWSVTDQIFEDTDQLANGELVLGDRGRLLTVSGLVLGTERTASAYNLSVDGVHTYHVGDDSILVHNCGGLTEFAAANLGKRGFPNLRRYSSNIDDWYGHLKRNHGIDPNVARTRLHQIKEAYSQGSRTNPDVWLTNGGEVWGMEAGNYTLLGSVLR